MKNQKLFTVLFVLAMLAGFAVPSAFAAGPAPVVLQPSEQSVLMPTTSIKVEKGLDGENYAMAAYNGFYGRVVVEYNATVPSLNTTFGQVSGTAADALVRTLSTKFMGATYALPAAMDTNVYAGLVKSGLKNMQIEFRANTLSVSANGKLINTTYMDGLMEAAKMVETSEVLTGTVPAGTADAIIAGYNIVKTIGFEEWDIAVIIAENYRPNGTTTWSAHRDNTPIKISSLMPAPAPSATPAPAGKKQAALVVKSGEGPWNSATRLSAYGYDFNATYTYLQTVKSWTAGMIIPLSDDLKSKESEYEVVGK